MAVGLGGIIGALLRYGLSISMQSNMTAEFPLATLLANYLGCFALGWFNTYLAKIKSVPVWLQLAFGTGLIGSFTTFSTFSLETIELIFREKYSFALLYVTASLFGGLVLVWFGSKMAHWKLKIKIWRM